MALAATLAIGIWSAGAGARAFEPAGPEPSGALSVLRGPGACLGVNRHACAALRGPVGLLQIAVSADGRDLYAVGQGGGLAILARDSRSGRLRQLPGRAGCLRSDGRQECTTVAGFGAASSVTVSPDGRSVYVAVAHGVLAFARQRNGALRPLRGQNACVDAVRGACRLLHGLDGPVSVVAGTHVVYLAGITPDSAAASDGALAVLGRDPVSGALAQAGGAAGCFAAGGAGGCTAAPCLYALTSIALSPDNRYVYTGSTDSLDIEFTSPGAVASFARAPVTGALSYIGCAQRAEAVADLVALPRSRSVLVATLYGDRGTGFAGSELDLYSPSRSGALTRTRRVACLDQGCPPGLGPSTDSLAVTPDGSRVYVGLFDAGIQAGRLTPGSYSLLGGGWGCLVATDAYMPPARCRRAGQDFGAAVVMAPDGRELYAGTLGGASGNLYAGGIETLSVHR
ncbi:MAG: lactonase family protein [Solirubrobacteraceae bacterium]